jgi:hypothetical protein
MEVGSATFDERTQEGYRPVTVRTAHGNVDLRHDPKRLVIVPGGHVLDEAAEEVHAEVRDWLLGEMAAGE